jgi:hypothetical protein
MNISFLQPMFYKAALSSWLLVLGLFQILPVHAQATSWPTDWSCEPLQDTSGAWWESLRIATVPGVLYHLQESESLAEGTWSILQTSYGTGTEWICPLFPGKAPTEAPPNGLAAPPVIPAATGSSFRNVFLTIENTTTGSTLISWNSLDDSMPKRMILPGVTLDPVWYDFDSSYLLAHGSYFYGLSPRLGTPLDFSGTTPSLGPLDSAMVEDFIVALPEITTNFSNSVASAAASFGQRPEANGDRKFFRVAADWSIDSDGDGRYDWQEIIFDGNNPFADDSDGDGNSDVAQDNSGEAPTIESGTAPSGSNANPPPRATIERNFIYASRIVNYRPNWPGWEPLISLSSGGPVPYPTESLRDKTTFSAFSDAVAELDLNENGWVSWLMPYNSKYYKSVSLTETSDPRLLGSYGETFHVTRCAYRLRLDTAAPAGGYAIPLRIMSYAFTNMGGSASHRDGPFSGVGYEDIVLIVAEGETVGEPVFAVNPAPDENQQVNQSPLHINLHNYNIEQDPQYLYKPFDEGACIQLGDAVDAHVVGYFTETDEITIQWQTRRLSGDGSLDAWETATPLLAKVERDDPEPPHDLNSRQFAYIKPEFPGIFQFRAVFNFPDGTKIPAPYLRMAHAKGRFDGSSPRDPNLHLEAGQPDYLGVCRNELSLKLRNEAIRWLEKTDYSYESRVPINPGWPYNPSTFRKNKCNLFLTHLSNRVGANTPYFYRRSKKHWITSLFSLIPSAPLAREDWHLNPERNIDLDGPGWYYRGIAIMPSPGMSTASHGNPPSSGHCGILDYDGSWISAGRLDVNKSIHLSDQSQHYKPTHFRER